MSNGQQSEDNSTPTNTLSHNTDELNKLMQEAKDYYIDIPNNVWEIPEIRRRVFSGNALDSCPENGLLGMTVCGYEFKYAGIPFEYALETLAAHSRKN